MNFPQSGFFLCMVSHMCTICGLVKYTEFKKFQQCLFIVVRISCISSKNQNFHKEDICV